jgi:hypothetical protein
MPHDAIRGGVELQELLLEHEMPGDWELIEFIALERPEVRCDAELPFDDSATI